MPPTDILYSRKMRPPITDYLRLDELQARQALFAEASPIEEYLSREEELAGPVDRLRGPVAAGKIHFTYRVTADVGLAPAIEDYLLHYRKDIDTLLAACEDLRKENAYLRFLHAPSLAEEPEKKKDIPHA